MELAVAAAVENGRRGFRGERRERVRLKGEGEEGGEARGGGKGRRSMAVRMWVGE